MATSSVTAARKAGNDGYDSNPLIKQLISLSIPRVAERVAPKFRLGVGLLAATLLLLIPSNSRNRTDALALPILAGGVLVSEPK